MILPVTDDTFHELVRETLDPVIVLFTSSLCQSCQETIPIVESYAETIKDNLKIFIADNKTNKEVINELNINTFPSLVLFSDGMLRDVLTNTHSRNDLRLWVQDTL